ncbi:MAG: lipid-A-disaccharide synthase [Bacteroidota bacterium]
MKYFLIAGEASGDLHASNLMKGLKQHDPLAEFRFMGGDLMKAVSDGMVVHYRETNYMMLDVLLHLGKIFKSMRRVKSEIQNWQPDVVIPVDFPGFNMRMARFASSLGLKVFYFISPKVWAWKQRRVKLLQKFTSRLFVILPFEVEFFRRFDMEVEYFGNPLVDEIYNFRKEFKGKESWKKKHGMDDKPIVALLAGSRRKEIDAMLPHMVKVAGEHKEYRFVVAGAPSIEPSLYDHHLRGSDVGIVYHETYALLESAMAGLITSGTATLEAALFDVPQVVLYKTGWLAAGIGKRLIKINFISLVNLIYGKQLVAEIIQRDLTERAMKELSRILEDAGYRNEMKEGYKSLQRNLGEYGVSQRIGHRMVELLKGNLE